MKTPFPIVAHLALWRTLAWSFFLAASFLMLIIVPGEIGEAQLRAWLVPGSAQEAAIQIVKALDGTWIALAAINTYLWLVSTEGLQTARRWALITLLAAAAISSLNTRIGFPFGPLTFTDNLGLRIAHVLPFPLPLLWFVVMINGRSLVRSAFPHASHSFLALGTGLLVLLTDLNLEPIAWKMRAWWLWYPLASAAPACPPLRNYLTWFALAFGLSLLLREKRVTALSTPSSQTRPLAIFAILNGVLLAANFLRSGRQLW